MNDLIHYIQCSIVSDDCKTGGRKARVANNRSLWWLIQCANQKGRSRGVKEPSILPVSILPLSLPLLVPHKSKNDYTCKYTGPRFRHQLCFTEIPLTFCLSTNQYAWKIANDPHVSPRLRAEKISLSHGIASISREIPNTNILSGFFSRKLHADVCYLLSATNTFLLII